MMLSILRKKKTVSAATKSFSKKSDLTKVLKNNPDSILFTKNSPFSNFHKQYKDPIVVRSIEGYRFWTAEHLYQYYKIFESWCIDGNKTISSFVVHDTGGKEYKLKSMTDIEEAFKLIKSPWTIKSITDELHNQWLLLVDKRKWLRDEYMYMTLYSKFQNLKLREKLLATEDKKLVEKSYRDGYWWYNPDTKKWENRLWMLLMKLRADITN